ncbi:MULTISPECIES: DUF5663 domain-containing protein [Gordonia]|uniref:DUF5663 domain-containing protein n=1 Tax=Gordonia TaxID=2053 RepID=UPI0007EA66F3|nr:MULTISPECIES: DUF5663 domain-containing protein [Gordonia]OBA32501.1 hypothetical protein A5766_12795 [Gordonia sp. 852002-51296_SCH5728562-b]
MTAFPPALDILGNLRRLVPAEFADSDLADLADTLYGELTRQVGERMCAGLSDEHIAAFDQLDDEADQLAFIEHFCPHYRDIVKLTYDELMREIKEQLASTVH